MQCRPLLAMMILVTGCGDSGPEADSYTGVWLLTSVNVQPLPWAGNATGGEVWLGARLELGRQSGTFDRCLETSPVSIPLKRSTGVVVTPISGDRLEVSYFDRSEAVPDTATLNGTELTLRYRNVISGEVQGVDVLTFIPLTGPDLTPCSVLP